MFNIKSIELHTLYLNKVLVVLTAYPAPKQGSGTVLFRVSDLRVGGRYLAMPLYKRASGNGN